MKRNVKSLVLSIISVFLGGKCLSVITLLFNPYTSIIACLAILPVAAGGLVTGILSCKERKLGRLGLVFSAICVGLSSFILTFVFYALVLLFLSASLYF